MKKLNMTAIMNKQFSMSEPVDDSESFWSLETSDFPTQKEAWEIVFKSASNAIGNEPNSWLMRKSLNLIDLLDRDYIYSPSSPHFGTHSKAITRVYNRPQFTHLSEEEIRNRLLETTQRDKEAAIEQSGDVFGQERVLGTTYLPTDSEEPSVVWATDFYPFFKASLRESLAFMMVTTDILGLYAPLERYMTNRYTRDKFCVWDDEKQKFVRIHNLMNQLGEESTSITFPLVTCKILLTMLADASCTKKLKEDIKNNTTYTNFRGQWSYMNYISGLSYTSAKVNKVMKRWARFLHIVESMCMYEIKSRTGTSDDTTADKGKDILANVNFDGLDSPEVIAKSMLSSGLGASSLSIFGENEMLFSNRVYGGKPDFFKISNDVTYEFCTQALRCRKTSNFKFLSVQESVASLNLKQASGKKLAEFINDNNMSSTIKTLRALTFLAPLISNLEEFNSILFQWQFDEDPSIQDLVSSFDSTIKQRQRNEEAATKARHANNIKIFAETVYPMWQEAFKFSQMHQRAAKYLVTRVTSLPSYFDDIDGVENGR